METLNYEQKTRWRKLGKKTIGFLIVGVVYFFFVLFTKWRIPCVFYAIIHKYCPGCGLTRMFMALGKLDFPLAFRSNAYVFVLLPIAIAWGIYRGVIYVKHGTTAFSKAENICLIVAFVLAVAFTVLRNLAGYSWLLPIGY